ncbi:helix-turn-helix domain-containing protein [Paraburkholderia sp. CNPSo 3272]|uniref:helix-turn-helix domain-containing protein n=1 Tax=Paraburkholderia sp. CNPSo 3272 TaxID=2940931 RepID=UPI0020B6C93D|nr:helix-turn-helix transcriptional regulator [Paraburkholderia sp. CNPSo 3272]MCP3721758.1 helix-turn-helix domain-containing protein [Paraburkholderia sp. CNPSo 3272]
MNELDTFVGRLLHAKKIREAELGASIGNKEIASKAEVSPSAISQWMHGNVNTENLKAAHVFRVARFLRVRPDWLWDRRGSMRDALDELPDSAKGLLNDLKRASAQGVAEIAIPAMQGALDAVLKLNEQSRAQLLDMNAPTPPGGSDSSRKPRRT